MKGVIPALLLAMVGLGAGGVSAQEDSAAFENFSGYPDAPAFSVVPRKDELVFYPCSQCHEFMEPDATVRELMSPHEVEFKHGQGRFWCFSCHSLDNRDELVTINGQAVDIDDAHQVCGGCHGLRHKDWHFGAHGKRQTGWNEERVIYNCTHCHDAHDPAMKPRKPMAPPGVRTGLELKRPESHDRAKIWERHADDSRAEKDHDKKK